MNEFKEFEKALKKLKKKKKLAQEKVRIDFDGKRKRG